jgi:hypothetical protein
MAGLLQLDLLTDFFNKIGQKPDMRTIPIKLAQAVGE